MFPNPLPPQKSMSKVLYLGKLPLFSDSINSSGYQFSFSLMLTLFVVKSLMIIKEIVSIIRSIHMLLCYEIFFFLHSDDVDLDENISRREKEPLGWFFVLGRLTSTQMTNITSHKKSRWIPFFLGGRGFLVNLSSIACQQ